MSDWLHADVTPEYLKNPENVSQFVLQSMQMGQQSAQRRAQLEEEQRQFNELLPLRKLFEENQIKLQSLDIDKEQQRQQVMLRMRQAQPALGRVYSEISALPGAWSNPAADRIMGEYVIQHPEGADLPLFKIMQDNKLKATTEARRLQELEQKSLFKEAEIGLLRDRVELEKARVNIAEAKAGQVKNSPQWQAAEEILSTQDQLSQAQQSGNASEITRLTQKLQLLKDGFPTKGTEELELGQGADGKYYFRLTKGGKTTTNIATENLAQKNLMVAEKNYELLDELQRSIRPEDVGIRGVAGEVVLDRLLSQFNIPGFDPERVDNRTKLKVLIQSMVRQISSDTGRFSEGDRKRAEDAQASAGAMESYPRVIQSLKTLKEIIADRAKVDAQAGALPQPGFTMTPDEITQAVKSGKMTKERGTELRRRYYPHIYQ